ncbi:SdpI family protein [Altererythrobacter sp. MF3-039]|uniref:SdpI family protein n=1 Tax=Altererythrobacter sp. MF3-039 TaxID=3252901 RepID=UPI00390CD94A
MNIRPLAIASLMLAASLAIFAFVTASRLPAGAELPIHWNAAGEPDDYAPALMALLMPVGLVLFVTALFAIIPRIEPLQEKLEGSAPVLRASWIGVLLLCGIISLTIGLPAYGISLPIKTVFIATGLLLVLIGNALPKSRPGFFVGIRTPWAIIDTDNWIATHRLGGRLFIMAGLAIVLAGVLPIEAETTAIVLILAVAAAAVIPFVYSWWLWRRSKDLSA